METRLSLWRLAAFLTVAFLVSRLIVDVMYAIALPLEWRLLFFVVTLPYLGFRAGPYLFVRR